MNGLIGLKKLRPTSLLLFSALTGIAAGPAISQIRPMGVATQQHPLNPPRTAVSPKARTATPATRIAPDAPVPGNPDYKADQPQAAQAAPVAPALPPAVWDVPSALELVAYINQIGGEGLNPADYDPVGLQAAIQSGNVATISA